MFQPKGLLNGSFDSLVLEYPYCLHLLTIISVVIISTSTCIIILLLPFFGSPSAPTRRQRLLSGSGFGSSFGSSYSN